MRRHLCLLAVLQGLFLTNNVAFIAINGLVGLSLAPQPWMATLPVMAYVVGGALCTGLVARTQTRWGRRGSFASGLVVAAVSALLCALAAHLGQFWLLIGATLVAGYYSANGQLYRFASAELVPAAGREQAVSLVMAGGLIGAVLGPNLAQHARQLTGIPFVGAYLALAVVAGLGLLVLWPIRFPQAPPQAAGQGGRPLREIARQPAFLVAAGAGALGYGVMNLLMAATPLAMQQCGLAFEDAAWVLEWHVVGMFAPGFFTGRLLQRWGVTRVMALGLVLNGACVALALSGQALAHFTGALVLLGVGWNFLFTGATSLALRSYRPEERDRAQAAINRVLFATMALTSLASGLLVTTGGWAWLNLASLLPLGLIALGLAWLARLGDRATAPA